MPWDILDEIKADSPSSTAEAWVREFKKDGRPVFCVLANRNGTATRVSPFFDTEETAKRRLEDYIGIEEARVSVRAEIAEAVAMVQPTYRDADARAYSERQRGCSLKGFSREAVAPVVDTWEDTEMVTLTNYKDISRRYHERSRVAYDHAKTLPRVCHKVTLEPIERILDGLRSDDPRIRKFAATEYNLLPEWRSLAGTHVGFDGDCDALDAWADDHRWNMFGAGTAATVRTRVETGEVAWLVQTGQHMANVEAYAAVCTDAAYINDVQDGLRLEANRDGFELIKAARKLAINYDPTFDFVLHIMEQGWENDRVAQYKTFRQRAWDGKRRDALRIGTYCPRQFGDDMGKDEKLTEEYARAHQAKYTYDPRKRGRAWNPTKIQTPSGRTIIPIRITIREMTGGSMTTMPVHGPANELNELQENNAATERLRAVRPDLVPWFEDRYKGGLEYQQIGAKHGVTGDTVRKQLDKALEQVFPAYRERKIEKREKRERKKQAAYEIERELGWQLHWEAEETEDTEAEAVFEMEG